MSASQPSSSPESPPAPASTPSSIARPPDRRSRPSSSSELRAIGLRLDRSGTFWHEGVAVTHPRLRQALLRWLDVREDGRDIVRLDDKRYAYVEVEDAHLRARSARWDGDRCFVLWDDDQESELDTPTSGRRPITPSTRTRAAGCAAASPAPPTTPSPSASSRPLAAPAELPPALDAGSAPFQLEAAGQRCRSPAPRNPPPARRPPPPPPPLAPPREG